MTNEQAIRLDTWLAAREAAGVRWITHLLADREGNHCVLGELMHEAGVADVRAVRDGLSDQPSAALKGTSRDLWGIVEREWGLRRGSEQQHIVNANNESDGDPKAVRAKLHELYPFLTETPAPTEVTA